MLESAYSYSEYGLLSFIFVKIDQHNAFKRVEYFVNFFFFFDNEKMVNIPVIV